MSGYSPEFPAATGGIAPSDPCRPGYGVKLLRPLPPVKATAGPDQYLSQHEPVPLMFQPLPDKVEVIDWGQLLYRTGKPMSR